MKFLPAAVAVALVGSSAAHEAKKTKHDLKAKAAVKPAPQIAVSDPLVSCPQGFELNGKNCEMILIESPTYLCKSGHLKGHECIHSSAKVPTCSTGFALIDSKCIQTVHEELITTCPVGHTAKGHECIAVVPAAVVDFCPHGIRQGSECIESSAVAPLVHSFCPEGTIEDKGACWAVEVTDCTGETPGKGVHRALDAAPRQSKKLKDKKGRRGAEHVMVPHHVVVEAAHLPVEAAHSSKKLKRKKHHPEELIVVPHHSYEVAAVHSGEKKLKTKLQSKKLKLKKKTDTVHPVHPYEVHDYVHPAPHHRRLGKKHKSHAKSHATPQHHVASPAIKERVIQKTCERKTEVPRVVTKTCPAGTVKHNEACIKKAVHPLAHKCTAEGDLANCHKTIHAAKEHHCGVGFTRVGDRCLLTTTLPAAFVCPEGTTQAGKHCLTSTPATPTCERGALASGGVCLIKKVAAPSVQRTTVCTGKACLPGKEQHVVEGHSKKKGDKKKKAGGAYHHH